MSTPLVLTLYGKGDEIIQTFTRSVVPWQILKKAIKLKANLIDINSMNEENVNDLAAMVVAAFDDQFTVEQLDKGADLGEMMTVLNTIMARAGGVQKENPTEQA